MLLGPLEKLRGFRIAIASFKWWYYFNYREIGPIPIGDENLCIMPSCVLNLGPLIFQWRSNKNE
jgi:hypothetical protein